MFPVNGSLRMAPLFPRSGPGESGSPTSQVLLRCYDLPSRIAGHLFASLPGSARSSSVRVSQLALPRRSESLLGQGRCSTGDPICRFARTRTCAGSPRFPGNPSRAFAPLLRPRPNRRSLASLTVFVDAVPALPTAKTSALNEFRGSITRLWHLLPTLQDRCCHHPCKARFRLAGSPLPGEGVEPSGSLQKVSDRSLVLLFWIYPGAREVSRYRSPKHRQ